MKATLTATLSTLAVAVLFSVPASPQDRAAGQLTDIAYRDSYDHKDSLGLDSRGSLTLISAHSIRLLDERQTGAAYLRDLRKRVTYNSEEVAQWLSLDNTQLNALRKQLESIEREDVALVRNRIEAMCETWRQLPQTMTELERANAALAEFTRLEDVEIYANSARLNFFRDISEFIGDEAVDMLRNEMHAFGLSSTRVDYSWESLVHTIGKEVEQINFSCG